MSTFQNTLFVPSSQAEDGTDRVFQYVGIQNSDAVELPRRKHTTVENLLSKENFSLKISFGHPIFCLFNMLLKVSTPLILLGSAPGEDTVLY